MNQALGTVSTLAWLALSVVLLSGVIHGEVSMLWLNVAFAAFFACVSLFTAWRTAVVYRLRQRNPDNEDVARVLLVDAISAAVGLILTVLAVSAAAFRVYLEGVPVFG